MLSDTKDKVKLASWPVLAEPESAIRQGIPHCISKTEESYMLLRNFSEMSFASTIKELERKKDNRTSEATKIFTAFKKKFCDSFNDPKNAVTLWYKAKEFNDYEFDEYTKLRCITLYHDIEPAVIITISLNKTLEKLLNAKREADKKEVNISLVQLHLIESLNQLWQENMIGQYPGGERPKLIARQAKLPELKDEIKRMIIVCQEISANIKS